jgi:hypothetical protein
MAQPLPLQRFDYDIPSQERAEWPRLAAVTAAGDRRTRVSEIPGGGHTTKVMPERGTGTHGSGGDRTGPADTRRIVGVIVTYSWRPEGQLFTVREGKNYIGADRVSSEPDHQLCHILIPNDTKMSAEHALILCRHGRYDIIDQKSSNGTFLGEELVPLQGAELPNYAEIRTGATVWSFIKIEPPAGTATRAAPQPSAEEPQEPPTPTDRRPSKVL